MKTKEFVKMYSPCKSGELFALQFEEMSDVWNKCERLDWLFYMMRKTDTIKHEEYVKLTVLFCRELIHLIPEESFANLNKAEDFLGIELSVFNPDKYHFDKNAISCEYDMKCAKNAALCAYHTTIVGSIVDHNIHACNAAHYYTYAANQDVYLAYRYKACQIIRDNIANPFV